jgi:hypothetical protein
MATIKGYTDLSQSKKLAEILPLESADMCYRYYSGGMITGYGDCVLAKSFITGKNVIRENDFPCWSLAVLLGVLPEKYTELIKEGGMYRIIIKDSYMTCLFDNPVDACYSIIIKLHELKKL